MSKLGRVVCSLIQSTIGSRQGAPYRGIEFFILRTCTKSASGSPQDEIQSGLYRPACRADLGSLYSNRKGLNVGPQAPRGSNPHITQESY